MTRPPRFSLTRLVEGMATLAAPRHRELVRAMVSELEAIADAAERRRFAAGAIAAIVRLALTRLGEAAVPRSVHILPGDPSMPSISTRRLLRRHIVPFAVTFAVTTGIQLAQVAANIESQVRGWKASLPEALLLAAPSVVALSIPVSVFFAVLWVFTRLGREGVLAEARREPDGVRRLVGPVLAAAAVVTALMLASNTQLLPRANGEFQALVTGRSSVEPNDRSMTVGELREAARTALVRGEPAAAARAAAYEVEVQKKFAISAACLVLALAAATLGLRFPRGGLPLLVGASGVLVLGYYLALVGGEVLADQRVVSPWVGMWAANACLLAIALLLARRSAGGDRGRPGDAVATMG